MRGAYFAGGVTETSRVWSSRWRARPAPMLLVMDMHEYSYQMDFGAAVPRFFANGQWDEVNSCFERAQRLRAAL